MAGLLRMRELLMIGCFKKTTLESIKTRFVNHRIPILAFEVSMKLRHLKKLYLLSAVTLAGSHGNKVSTTQATYISLPRSVGSVPTLWSALATACYRYVCAL
jgi:hypothetical protein